MCKDFTHLITTWPRRDKLTSIGSFAKDLGVGYDHANVMQYRNSISVEFWPRLLKAALLRGKALSHDKLLKMREASRRAKARGEGRGRPSERTQTSRQHAA